MSTMGGISTKCHPCKDAVLKCCMPPTCYNCNLFLMKSGTVRLTQSKKCN